jgi:elongator complex protein 3
MNMEEIVKKIIKNKPKNTKELTAIKRLLAKEYKTAIWSNSDIYKEYQRLLVLNVIKQKPHLEVLLRKRSIRTMSGIAPVAVLTKPFPCPGKCAYCPHEKNVPTSYLSNEPAVMRAIRNDYDPYRQTYSRLQALKDNGHRPEKIELIVIGGSWSVLPRSYKFWFIKECFRAANDFQLRIKNYELRIKKQKGKTSDLKSQLIKEQKRNEKAKYKIIGVTLETRPDYINEKELIEMRELGATRVELGVQAPDDDILKKNKRGHGVKEVANATALLRLFGFKITYHLMPGLPGSTPRKDLKMFKEIFSDNRFQPDQIKFYPAVVVKGSEMYHWWKAGKYKPYSDKVLEKLIIDCKSVIPEYVRIIRLIRDIPGESIEAGNKITNLRQVMEQKGVKCGCIRCRECREKKSSHKTGLEIITYSVNGGVENFLQFVDKKERTLYGFCRVFIPDGKASIKNQGYKFLSKSALVRELHVYGELVPMGDKKKTQHAGLGKKLLSLAEKIARDKGLSSVAVISGVGARGYYRKHGYRLGEGYMVKTLS